MRDSQYLHDYLATTASGRLLTPGTYLKYTLRGKAKDYIGKYEQALVRSLERAGAKEVKSAGNRKAYVR